MGQLNGCLVIDRNVAADRDASERVRDTRDIHTYLPTDGQREQAARCMDCGVPFCHGGRILSGMASGCPLHNLIPEFNDMLYRSLDSVALARLLRTNPLPEFTGRVCPAPCEAACVCGFNQEPVTIKANELSIIEMGFNAGLPPIKTNAAYGRVAVVGSGPAGLACAVRLRQLGFGVDVYERADRPGGLLMYGIPNMKLEKDVVQRRVDWMERSGVKFILGTEVDNLAELAREYAAVALCTGSTEPRDLNVPGRNLDGIHFAVDYLTQATKAVLDGGAPSINAHGKNVVIIGGGDTGNDCVATAIRQGAKSVTQLEIMPKPPTERLASNPWPEWSRTLKTDYGQEEATALFGNDPRVYEAATSEFIGENGRVVRLAAKVKGVATVIDADMVLLAMGFVGAEKRLVKSLGVGVDDRGRIASSKYETSINNVYAAGDARRGQSLVVWAIREGIEAAEAIAARHVGGAGC